MSFREKLGRFNVETPSGSWWVISDDGKYLVKSVDAWKMESPCFDHVDFSMRFTEKQAVDQVYILGYEYNIKARAVWITKAR